MAAMPARLARVVLVCGAPQRPPGCISGFSGPSSFAGVAGAGARALPAVAVRPLEPDPELPGHEAASGAMTVAPPVTQRPRLRSPAAA